MRLQRILASPTASALQIRATAKELSHIGLEDALALLDREPHTFSRSAARWGSRLVVERRLSLEDVQLVLAALATLLGPGARAGVEALIELCERHRLRRADRLLGDWLRARSTGG